MRRARDPEAGFTLIEALVAMAVLALGAVSLLTAAEGHTARIGALSDRVAARWAADYTLAALRLGLDEEASARRRVMGYPMNIRTDTSGTGDPDLEHVTIRVARDGDDVVLHVLDGYIDTGGATP